ncbi:ATP-binding protein [uncultured Paraglaciecola sp.]|uniref:sensor histidine kinase n=1 Tax=uncultured Paraglaciecola sp. TaxID=1765024 RepID=UPI0026134042|nr:ATP-binding protein [uncultured Paraglaciecola sp.]
MSDPTTNKRFIWPRLSLFGFANRMQLQAILVMLPLLFSVYFLLWHWDLSSYGKWLISILLTFLALGYCWHLKQQLNYHFQTLSNLLEGIRTEDFTIRGKVHSADDPLFHLITQINELTDVLALQKITSEEANKLLEKTIAQIDVAIFAFDSHQNVKLANPAAAKLLALEFDKLMGKNAFDLQLAAFLDHHQPQLIEHAFAGATGRWQVRCEGYRDKGQQRQLLFITDLRQVLRNEELNAWKNLMRVVSHEVNNSLFPISSLSQTLQTLTKNHLAPTEKQQDILQGLDIINERAVSLSEFIKRYARLARLPVPNKRFFNFNQLIQRVMGLFEEGVIHLEATLLEQTVELVGDEAMLEQVLINLVKNAIEAGAPVKILWDMDTHFFRLSIIDSGVGITNLANIFVPFYSTKTTGSGIGLVLCRQILESHKGSLTLENVGKTDLGQQFNGCIARINLPLE